MLQSFSHISSTFKAFVTHDYSIHKTQSCSSLNSKDYGNKTKLYHIVGCNWKNVEIWITAMDFTQCFPRSYNQSRMQRHTQYWESLGLPILQPLAYAVSQFSGCNSRCWLLQRPGYLQDYLYLSRSVIPSVRIGWACFRSLP